MCVEPFIITLHVTYSSCQTFGVKYHAPKDTLTLLGSVGTNGFQPFRPFSCTKMYINTLQERGNPVPHNRACRGWESYLPIVRRTFGCTCKVSLWVP